MRIYLMLLLCFVVAFQGKMETRAFRIPCPMDQSDPLDLVAKVLVAKPVPVDRDCCNDDETAAKTGKPCKAESPYSSSSACVFASFHPYIPYLQAQDPVLALTTPIATFYSSAVWRPPSLS